MTSIDEIWQDLERDLSEAQESIESLEKMLAVAEGGPECTDDRFLIPYPVIEAYVYRGETILRAWRKHLGLTCEDLAERTGIALLDVVRMDSIGSINREYRARLASAMDVRQEFLAAKK